MILDTTLTQNPEQLDNVLETLLSRPEFAWNLLVFTGDEETLRRADEKKENWAWSWQPIIRTIRQGRRVVNWYL